MFSRLEHVNSKLHHSLSLQTPKPKFGMPIADAGAIIANVHDARVTGSTVINLQSVCANNALIARQIQ